MNADVAYTWGLLDEIVAPTSTKKYDIEGIDINNQPLHRAIELADSIGVNV